MADPIESLPQPTKNILELDDAAPFNGTEYAEVVQNGNSRKFVPLPQTDAELLGAPIAQSPDPGVYDNRIATMEAVKAELDALNLNPDAPGIPTLPVLETRTQLDQDGKVALFVIVSWTPPVPAPERWNYEVRYTKDGVDPDSRIVGENRAKFRVESGAEYLFKVRTVSKDDKSNWLEFPPITPLKKSTLPPAPTALTANGQHRRVVLRWADPRIANPTYYDHYATWIYRATSNNFLAAQKIDETASTAFVDDNLPNGTDYWYWIVHVDTSRNQSNKHPSSNTAGVHAKTNRITDDDTDDDAPGKPTNLVLTPRVERTDDGNLEVNLIITWNAPAGGLSAKGEYVVWIQESTSNDKHVAVTDNDERFLKYRGVRTNRTYDVKVRARKGGGKQGEWCDVVQITIGKKSSYNTAVPSGLTVTTEHKRNILTWDELTGLDALDYKFTKIYRATTNNFAAATVIGRPRDNAFIDGKVPNQTRYYYWIAHVDRSMNEGPRFPAGPTTNNGISAGADSPKILRADVNDLAIDTDQMEYHSISAADRFNIPMTMVAHKQTTASPGGDINWTGDGAGDKVPFNNVCGLSEKVRNHNPTPVRITGTMSLMMKAKDSSSMGDGKTEVFASLKLEFKKWDAPDSAWKSVPRFKGPGVKTVARGSKDISGDNKKNVAVSIVHRVKDADSYRYRVRLSGYHRRGAGRDWILCDISMDCHLTMQYTRR